MGYFYMAPIDADIEELLKAARGNLRLHYGPPDYLIGMANTYIDEVLERMKQQIYEAAFEDVAKELNKAKEYLSNIGRYDDTASQVTAAIANLDRALEIYNETQNISAPALPGREVQEG